MNLAEVQAYCASMPGAQTELHGAPSNVLVYAVGGKQFAYAKTSQPEQGRFSFRVTPERFLELTDIPGIKPARYMARFHWVSVVNVASMPDQYLQELLAWSYAKARASLSKQDQAELENAK